MVLILLSLKANLEFVDSFWIPEGSQYCLTIKNSVGEDVRENVFVCADELYDLTGSRGTANFTVKWEKDSKKEAYLNITAVKNITRRYTADDSGKFVPFIAFDCRGLEPIAFHPQDQFTVKSKDGTVFENVDLSDKEWADSDEAGNCCTILELEWKLEATKA